MNAISKVNDAINSQCNQNVEILENSVIPDYLQEVYRWAYLDARNAKFLDREWVVNTILWGNAKRLRQAVLSEVKPGSKVLQVAHVYGKLIPELAKKVGPQGVLEVIDIAPLQVSLCEKKLTGFENSSVRIANAASCSGKSYDIVDCFFLLHEVPDELKRAIVNNLLSSVVPGGKAIFVDYHGPSKWHPLRAFMRFIFRRLEPFAESLWHNDIASMAERHQQFKWTKKTFFGGLYQLTIAQASASPDL